MKEVRDIFARGNRVDSVAAVFAALALMGIFSLIAGDLINPIIAALSGGLKATGLF